MWNTVATLVSVLFIQTALASIDDYPKACTPVDKATYDFIIVGCGTAGSVLASRLTEVTEVKVLAIEAGGYPTTEAELPGAFASLPQTSLDYNFTSVDNKCTGQNLQGATVKMTQGKGLGGTGLLNHMAYTQGNALDYRQWAAVNGDDTWNRTNIQRYFWRIEHLFDEEILKSNYSDYHGQSGYLNISRDPSTSSVLKDYLNAFAEIGQNTPLDTSGNISLGYCRPLYNIYDGVRQSTALAYLRPAKDRENLCIALNTTATKVLFYNGSASGVEIVNADGKTLQVFATKEVIISAGAINSPKILLNSGIGPAAELEKLKIESVVDSPVGENLLDHPSVALLIQMDEATAENTTSDLTKFPVPAFQGYAAMDPSQTDPDYQTVNLIIPADSAAIEAICSVVFSYNEDICSKFVAANKGRKTYLVLLYLMKPNSRGKVALASSDYSDAPVIDLGTYSNSSDLDLMAKSLKHFSGILESTYFKSVNASMVDMGVCSDEEDFWKCYAVAMSVTSWQYGGTCAMGKVLDSAMSVKGVKSLRVIDSSAMPILTSGEALAAVTVIAEKGSDELFYKWQGQLGQ